MNESVPQAEETPAPDANATEEPVAPAESSTAEETTEESAEPAKKPSDGGFQRRISELTRNYRETERERDYLRQELERLRTQPVQKSEPEPAGKSLADFDYDERKYQSYLFSQAEQRAVQAAEKRLKEESERASTQRRQSEFARREEKFAKGVEDYHEVTRSEALPITPAMSEVIAESDEGPALAYYLGKNLPIAESIARLSPLAAARELGRIEAKLLAERAAAKKPQVSKAPPPPPKIEGAGDGSTKVSPDSPDSDKLSTSEWMKAREKQLNRKR
jgi:hypothetical protein